MSPLRQTLEIARRDLFQRAKSKAFLVTMGITLTAVLAIGPLLSLATEGDSAPEVVGLAGDVPPTLADEIRAAADEAGVDVVTRRLSTATAPEDALRRGDALVVVVDGDELVWLEGPVFFVERVVVAGIQAVARSAAIRDLGLTPEEAARLVSPPLPGSVVVEDEDPEEEPRRLGAFLGTVLLYMSILIFGQFVLMGVLEEKSSRVVEVVLSRVRPRQVLVGKVIGLGVLGLSQLLVFGGAIWFSMSQVDFEGVSLSQVSIGILVPVVVWFLLGYAFFSVLYAALGATISRQEDMQSVVMIPVLLLLPGYFISLIGGEDPTMTLVRVASLVPPTSPMVMPMRQAVSDVPLWEVGLAAALIVVVSWGLILLGGRIYRGAILRIGAKVRLREAWRAASR